MLKAALNQIAVIEDSDYAGDREIDSEQEELIRA